MYVCEANMEKIHQNFTNSSYYYTEYTTSINTLILLIMALVSIATITGNGLVCLAIWKDPQKQLRSPFSPYVLNLSITDFFVGSITQPLHITYKLTEPTYPGIVKPYYELCFFILGSASALSLCILCLDRYNAMVYPLAYRTRDRRKRWIVLMTIVWTVSVICPLTTYCISDYQQMLFYFLHVVVLTTFFVLLFTCTSILLCKDQPHMPSRRASDDDQNDEERFAKCKRIASRISDSSVFFDAVLRRVSTTTTPKEHEFANLTKIFNKRSSNRVGRIFVVMLSEYATCFIPPLVLVNYVYQCTKCRKETIDLMQDMIHLSVATFSMLNPFIYCWRLSTYRKAIYLMLRLKKVRRASTSPSDTIHNNSTCDADTPIMYPEKIIEEDELSCCDEGYHSASIQRRAYSYQGKCLSLKGSLSHPDFTYAPARLYIARLRSVSI